MGLLVAWTTPANLPPTVDSLSAPAASVEPGGMLLFTVQAHDPDCADSCTAGCGQYVRADLTVWSATGGTLAPSNGASGSPYTATALWQAPSTEGSYTVTVVLYDSGTFMCGGRLNAQASVTVQVSSGPPNLPPTVGPIAASPARLLPSGAATLSAEAQDPEGSALLYTWSADRGSVAPGAPGEAIFTAPPEPGLATVTLVVTDDRGATASRTVGIPVVSAEPEATYRQGLRAPQRIAADADGYLFVADRSVGGLVVLSGSTGQAVRTLPVPGISSVAVEPGGTLVVGTDSGALRMDRSGVPLGSLAPAEPMGRVQDVAADPRGGAVGVLYGAEERVVLFDAAGSPVLTLGGRGEGPGLFRGALSLACGPDGSWYVADSGHGQVHAFSPGGTYLRSFGTPGGGEGQFGQVAGVAVDSEGTVWASDAYQSRLQGFRPDGTLREILGGYGDGSGEFRTPIGVALMEPYGKIAVASLNGPAVQIFARSGATQPDPNRPPTAPVPSRPSGGAALPQGASVMLEALNASDPDFQSLTYTFELLDASSSPATLLQSWAVPEGIGTTSVDATSVAGIPGAYLWRVRAHDGLAPSPWSADMPFSVSAGQPNLAPGLPKPLGPVGGEESSDLAPFLVAAPASDPEGDPLTYGFEVALLVGGGYGTLTDSPPVPGGSGAAVWQVPAGVLSPSLEVFWKVRASDAYHLGPWTEFAEASFWTPPFAIPEAAEVGNLPEGDRTRPGEVRYRFGPTASDTPIYFQVFDVDFEGELTLSLNGQIEIPVPPQSSDAWSPTLSILLPAGSLRGDGENVVRFLHDGLLDPWGIRKVSLVAPPVPRLRAQPYNTVVDVAWDARPDLPEGTLLRLYRAFYASGPFVAIGDWEAGRGLVRDTGLENGRTYYYRAAFLDLDRNESEASPTVSAVPTGASGPTPITDLKARRAGDDLRLTWTPVTSLPALLAQEVYSDVPGLWAPDTDTFSNLLTIESPFSGDLLLPGRATQPDAWFSVIPLDFDNRRATP